MPAVVEVHWIDAHVSTSGNNIKRATKDKGVFTITTGFLVVETEFGLTIAMDWWPKTPKQFRVSTFVPWEMVREYYEYV